MSRPVARGIRTTLLVSFLLPLFLSSSARAQLADAPWPMLHHDTRHTGQSQHVGPQTPTLQWLAEMAYPRSSPTIGSNGVIYIGQKYSVYALNPADGSVVWDSFQHNLRRNSIAIDVNGRLYFGSRDNRVNVLDSTDQGALLWDYRIANDGDVNTSPVIAMNPLAGKFLLYAIGTWNGLVHAFDPDPDLDGQPSETRLVFPPTKTYNNSYSSPAVGPNGTIYSAAGGKLYAVKPDGEVDWSEEVGKYTRFTSPAVAADGTIYIGSAEGLSAVSPSGTLLWTFPVSGRVSSTPAIATDGTIYVGSVGTLSSPGGFYAIDPTDHSEIWSYHGPGGNGRHSFMSSPAIGADGTIYTAGANKVYAFTPDGDVLWEYETASRKTIVSSAAIGANGALYIGAGKGVYAFKDPEP